MSIRRAAALGAAFLILSLAAVACGGDDDGGDDATATRPAATSTRASTSTPAADDTEEPAAAETDEPAATATTAAPAPTTPPAPTTAPPPPPVVDTVNVSAGDFAFSPNAITVRGANDTSIFVTNTGAAPHTLNVYRDQAFTQAVPGAATTQLSGGASDDFTLTSTSIGGATQLFFRCEIHQTQMQGTITVN